MEKNGQQPASHFLWCLSQYVQSLSYLIHRTIHIINRNFNRKDGEKKKIFKLENYFQELN